jgi:iron(III) transport system substrate-binding protein
MNNLSRLAVGLLAAIALIGCAETGEQVNVYSERQEQLIKPVLDDFTEQTGIEVNLVTGEDDELIQRLVSEGRNSPADVLITADAGRLYRAKQSGVLQSVQSEVLEEVIPAHLRDPEGFWYGLSRRARPIMYAKARVDPAELSTYEALADNKWKGRVCVRSSSSIYNQSLVASMIASRGVKRAERWAKGLVDNFARPPTGGDSDQIMAVAAGECDVTIANTYYFGNMFSDADKNEREAAQQVAVFWPNQNGRGTHINVSGGGVTKTAKNKDNAIKLLEFLVSDEAQRWYAQANQEYPIKAGIPASKLLRSWGDFKADGLNLSKLGELNAEALKLMDRAGWQ